MGRTEFLVLFRFGTGADDLATPHSRSFRSAAMMATIPSAVEVVAVVEAAVDLFAGQEATHPFFGRPVSG